MFPFRLVAAASVLASFAGAHAAPPSCVAAGTVSAPKVVVELYTSEGCSSCPQADAWLSALPRDGSVLALAFHVDYWDSLGWADRFADAAYTSRQRHLPASSGARYVYTVEYLGKAPGESPEVRGLCNTSSAPRYQCERPAFRVTAYGRGRGLAQVVLQTNIISQPN